MAQLVWDAKLKQAVSKDAVKAKPPQTQRVPRNAKPPEIKPESDGDKDAER